MPPRRLLDDVIAIAMLQQATSSADVRIATGGGRGPFPHVGWGGRRIASAATAVDVDFEVEMEVGKRRIPIVPSFARRQ